MRNERSIPESAAEFDYAKAVCKSEDKFAWKYLQINKYLNRPLASILVRAVFRTRITPNQLTYAAFVIGLAGSYFLFRGGRGALITGGLLVELSSIVDCADGMLARARDQRSEFGAYLDLYLDRVNEYFLILASVVGYYKATGRLNILLLGLAALGLYFLQTTHFYLTKNYLKDSNKGETAENRGWFLFLICFFAVTNRIDLGVYVLTVTTVVANVVLTYNFFRLKRT
jgi:phosphatidylglycerophosphate synthase